MDSDRGKELDEKTDRTIKEELYKYTEPTTRTIVFTMVLAFTVPIVIMALALLKIQVWPGGKFTLLTYDMKGQFDPVISSLRYIGSSDNSMFLSFYGALGNNAFLNYAAYIFDPLMWLSVLFPIEQLPNIIYFITLIKIGACGLSASIYFFFGIRWKKYPVVILILSVCYALMSYNIMYSQCILWFNVTALVPVILIAIEQMIEGKRGGLYILCMTMALYYNYQMAYMTGIFAILYIIWRSSETRSISPRLISRFAVSNVLSAVMFMPIFLPIMHNIMNGRLKTANVMTLKSFYYAPWEYARQFLSCQYSSIESSGFPNLFCGTFIPMIALLAIILPVQSIRSRLISAAVILFFGASFCIVKLNQFWHGFIEPNSFPARYSFLLCLYLLILVYLVFCYVIEKRPLSEISLKWLYGIGMAITCIEMYLNAGFILTSLNLEMGYGISAIYQRRLSEVNDVLEKIDDDDFYRIGRDVTYSINDGMIHGYNGIGYFSSMFERNTMEFIGMLGYAQNEHSLRETGGTPVAESLLGVRYKILEYPKEFGYYKKIYSNDRYELQYNDNALPLGFLIGYMKYDSDNDDEISKGMDEHNSFSFQEYVLSEFCGKKVNAFDHIDYITEEMEDDDFARHIKMKFTATCDKPVWIYVKDLDLIERIIESNRDDEKETSDGSSASSEEKPSEVLLKVNGKDNYPFSERNSTMCVCLGSFKEGEEVEIEAAWEYTFQDPWVVYYNVEESESALKEIKKSSVEITEHKNGIIKGKVSATEDKDFLIMTLPYMKGYRVMVDGVRTQYGAYRGALMALKLEPGEHTIEISFIPYGLIPGMGIGIIGIVGTVLYLWKNRRRKIGCADSC